jgi:hypothetical protein
MLSPSNAQLHNSIRGMANEVSERSRNGAEAEVL